MIEVRDASYAYRAGSLAVDGVSLDVAPGERVVVLGRNGSGKSTLGRLLNGGLRPSEGTVRVDGESDGLARLVGYVRQDPRNQIVSALVEDEVAFGPGNLGLSREEVSERVGEALAACGIEALRGRFTEELSGGQQQLLALAGVLAMRPRYLVLDEAGSQLDEAARARIAEVVRRAAARGVGVLEIAHGVEALFGADRAVVLAEGRMTWEGTPQGLLAEPRALEAAGLDEDPLARVLARAAAGGWRLADGPQAPALVAAAGSLQGGSRTPRTKGLLRGKDVGVVYGELRALCDVCLEASGLTLVLGPSGSGKSTLARVLSGVLAPDEGSSELNGSPVSAGDVGLAFQRPEDQVFCDTVLDELAYGPRMRGASEAEADGAARLAAQELGVAGLLDRSPLELSGGQARRAALASVISARPRAYVLDEPTAGLDAPARRELRALVRTLIAEGSPVVVVTHDAAEWLEEAEEVVFLSEGRVVARCAGAEASRSTAPFAAAGLVAPLLVRLRAAFEGASADA